MWLFVLGGFSYEWVGWWFLAIFGEFVGRVGEGFSKAFWGGGEVAWRSWGLGGAGWCRDVYCLCRGCEGVHEDGEDVDVWSMERLLISDFVGLRGWMCEGHT